MYCTSLALAGDSGADLGPGSTNCFAVAAAAVSLVAVATQQDRLVVAVAAIDSVDCSPSLTQRLEVAVGGSKNTNVHTMSHNSID